MYTHIPNLSAKDLCTLCFQEQKEPVSTVDAIITVTDLFEIPNQVKIIHKMALKNPNAPVFILENLKTKSYHFSKMVTDFFLSKIFSEKTGLPRKTAFCLPEGKILKNILSTRDWIYFNVREKLGVSVLPQDKIQSVTKKDLLIGMEKINLALQQQNIQPKNLLIIAPAHTYSPVLAAQKTFDSADVAYIPYNWELNGLSFTSEMMENPIEKPNLLYSIYQRHAKNALYDEASKIFHHAQQKDISLPDKMTSVIKQYVPTLSTTGKITAQSKPNTDIQQQF